MSKKLINDVTIQLRIDTHNNWNNSIILLEGEVGHILSDEDQSIQATVVGDGKTSIIELLDNDKAFFPGKGAGYELPQASSSTLGGIKYDDRYFEVINGRLLPKYIQLSIVDDETGLYYNAENKRTNQAWDTLENSDLRIRGDLYVEDIYATSATLEKLNVQNVTKYEVTGDFVEVRSEIEDYEPGVEINDTLYLSDIVEEELDPINTSDFNALQGNETNSYRITSTTSLDNGHAATFVIPSNAYNISGSYITSSSSISAVVDDSLLSERQIVLNPVSDISDETAEAVLYFSWDQDTNCTVEEVSKLIIADYMNSSGVDTFQIPYIENEQYFLEYEGNVYIITEENQNITLGNIIVNIYKDSGVLNFEVKGEPDLWYQLFLYGKFDNIDSYKKRNVENISITFSKNNTVQIDNYISSSNYITYVPTGTAHYRHEYQILSKANINITEYSIKGADIITAGSTVNITGQEFSVYSTSSASGKRAYRLIGHLSGDNLFATTAIMSYDYVFITECKGYKISFEDQYVPEQINFYNLINSSNETTDIILSSEINSATHEYNSTISLNIDMLTTDKPYVLLTEAYQFNYSDTYLSEIEGYFIKQFYPYIITQANLIQYFSLTGNKVLVLPEPSTFIFSFPSNVWNTSYNFDEGTGMLSASCFSTNFEEYASYSYTTKAEGAIPNLLPEGSYEGLQFKNYVQYEDNSRPVAELSIDNDGILYYTPDNQLTIRQKVLLGSINMKSGIVVNDTNTLSTYNLPSIKIYDTNNIDTIYMDYNPNPFGIKSDNTLTLALDQSFCKTIIVNGTEYTLNLDNNTIDLGSSVWTDDMANTLNSAVQSIIFNGTTLTGNTITINTEKTIISSDKSIDVDSTVDGYDIKHADMETSIPAISQTVYVGTNNTTSVSVSNIRSDNINNGHLTGWTWYNLDFSLLLNRLSALENEVTTLKAKVAELETK